MKIDEIKKTLSTAAKVYRYGRRQFLKASIKTRGNPDNNDMDTLMAARKEVPVSDKRRKERDSPQYNNHIASRFGANIINALIHKKKHKGLYMEFYNRLGNLLIEAISPPAKKYKTLMRAVGRNTGFGKVTTNYWKNKIKKDPKRVKDRGY